MGFKVGGYATVWETEPGKGNFYRGRLSCSRKNKDTQEYEQDFSGFCMFIGEAKNKAAKLKARDRIRILDCEVTNKYDSETKREYTDYKIFDFEKVDSVNDSQGYSSSGGRGGHSKGYSSGAQKQQRSQNAYEGENDGDENLPF